MFFCQEKRVHLVIKCTLKYLFFGNIFIFKENVNGRKEFFVFFDKEIKI